MNLFVVHPSFASAFYPEMQTVEGSVIRLHSGWLFQFPPTLCCCTPNFTVARDCCLTNYNITHASRKNLDKNSEVYKYNLN